ncbi:MAG: TonB family protein, partial [Candidatus Hydrogenedentes bacterium]|nr:TonB family protein [Candidatus Hydrogenedentota bacterium]
PKAEPKPEPAQPGVSMPEELPSVLGYWGRLVKRKVEGAWRVPAGIRIDPDANAAMVSFWIDRQGALIGTPQIVKPARDPAVGASAVRAIKQAAPFPPLPEEYAEPEVQVVYTFVPVQ